MLETTQPLFAASQTRRYRGGCQCGSVVYEADLDLTVTCPQAPSVWERRARAFKIVCGEELLLGYQFSEASCHHFYCESCGARAFSHVSLAEHGDFYTVDVKSLHVLGTSLAPGQAREGATAG